MNAVCIAGKLLFDFFDLRRLETNDVDVWRTSIDCSDASATTAGSSACSPDSFVSFKSKSNEFTRLIVEWQHAKNGDESVLLSQHKDRWKLWSLMCQQADHDIRFTTADLPVADVFGALGVYIETRSKIVVQFFSLSTNTKTMAHKLRCLGSVLTLACGSAQFVSSVSELTAIQEHIFRTADTVKRYFGNPDWRKAPPAGLGPFDLGDMRSSKMIPAEDLKRVAHSDLSQIASGLVRPRGEIVCGRKGSTGYAAHHKRLGTEVFCVMKVGDQRDPPTREKYIYDQMKNEQGIVQCLESFFVAHGYMLILQRVNVFTSKKPLLSSDMQVNLILTGLRIIEKLHLKGFVHGDIKKENLGFDDKQRLCLFDFDGSFDVGRQSVPEGYPIREAVDRGFVDETVDIFRFGDVCFEWCDHPALRNFVQKHMCTGTTTSTTLFLDATECIRQLTSMFPEASAHGSLYTTSQAGRLVASPNYVDSSSDMHDSDDLDDGSFGPTGSASDLRRGTMKHIVR
eukprot:TRINITY_DN975_c0_g3_i1.p1 TRINITY_DN975_c0_g3~~TRINITY_DN975_c0_g3_i1.p1  ORF type:complete len:511 (-),score=67.36 TRINITY_DN975_c0_g3_i1:369-1901(-)